MTGSSQKRSCSAGQRNCAALAAQKEVGLDVVPAGDFCLYDHVLDTACMVGAVQEHYDWSPEQGEVPLATMFAMARGTPGDGTPALGMTKWFDTNYHCIVSELRPSQEFHLASCKVIEGRRFVP